MLGICKEKNFMQQDRQGWKTALQKRTSREAILVAHEFNVRQPRTLL